MDDKQIIKILNKVIDNIVIDFNLLNDEVEKLLKR